MAQLTASAGIVLKNILVTTDFSTTSVSDLALVVPITRESHAVIQGRPYRHGRAPSTGLGHTSARQSLSDYFLGELSGTHRASPN